MAILLGRETTVLVQGMTGRSGTFYSDAAIRYGSKYVAGVRPGKGGGQHLGLPLFNTVADACSATRANASLVVVPAHGAASAMIEAIEAELDVVVCVTERVPVHDMVNVQAALRGSRTRLVGPNSQGVLVPGICKIGVMSTTDASAGCIGIVSRSASLTSEIVALTTQAGLGQSTTVGVGGDPIHGIGFRNAWRNSATTARPAGHPGWGNRRRRGRTGRRVSGLVRFPQTCCVTGCRPARAAGKANGPRRCTLCLGHGLC